MEATGYTTLTRQSGLMREMQLIANNMANAETTGYRAQGLMFSEYVARAASDEGVSMAAGRVRLTSFLPGALSQTGSQFDLAIEGDGFFLVETPQGQRLTRAGAFAPAADGSLVTKDGYPVLDAGGAPLFVPPGIESFAIAQDGTISADGNPIGQVGLVRPIDPQMMEREGSTLFNPVAGFEAVENPMIRQGFVEGSNVNPIEQIARMVEVQRAYEMGQNFLQREDERIRAAMESFTK